MQAANTDYMGKLFVTVFAFAPALNKICTMTAKSAPYPSCTVTAFWLKYQSRVLGVPGACVD
jgi:hypothetical protein